MKCPERHRLRALVLATVALAAWLAGTAGVRAKDEAGFRSALSPAPERVQARDAWRLAEAHAATLPAADVVVGSGDSMLPVYPDRTVLVLQRRPMSELRAGMTVIFIGDRGRPVAHILVKKTWRGWLAQGLANSEPDRTRVRADNYMGTVVRAFLPQATETARATTRAAGSGEYPAGTGQ